MKIVCEKNDFLAGISTTQKALSSRTTIPSLEGVMIEAVRENIVFTATDLILTIESTIQADVVLDGRVLLPGRLLSEIIRKMPDGQIELEKVDNNVVISAENTHTTIASMNIDEYPSLPVVEETNMIKVPQNILKDLIEKTSFAVATDESRPILTGCLVEVSDNVMRTVALDGYRLAVSEVPFETGVNISVVVPGHAMSETAKILTYDDAEIAVSFHDKYVLFDLVHTKIIVRLLEGEFIKYKTIIPQDFATEVIVSRKLMEDGVERAALIAKENKTSIIVVSISNNKMVITSRAENGNAHEEINVSMMGKDIEIGFNSRYITDSLKAVNDEFVKISLKTNLSPCVITSNKDDRYLYLILPVRM